VPATKAKTISGPTEDAPAIAVARIGIVTGEQGDVSDWVDLQFNPSSLQLQVNNELKDTKNNERKQYVAKSNAKLTMDLQFDTTHNGDDVTLTTKKLQAFVAPPLPANQKDRQSLPPPTVLFEWGRLKFQGIAESYKETIDYFSADGVPLRASVTLTLSRQDQVFDRTSGPEPPNAGADPTRRDTPPGSPAGIASAGGAPEAARSLAASNGLENLRFGTGAALSVGASITLKPPAAFAAGGGGIGIDAGIEFGGSTGASVGGSAGIAIGAAPDAVTGISGLARLSASDGAFAALRAVSAGATEVRLNVARLQPQPRSATLSTDRNASFGVGGRATMDGPAGLRADVGAGGGSRGRLAFEE
jgi:hypothetical protein